MSAHPIHLKSRVASWGLVVGVGLFIAAPQASAVLIPAVGPGTGIGRIEHANGALFGGGALPLFDGTNYYFDPSLGVESGGAMSAPGGFFPSLGAIPWPAAPHVDTGGFGMTANVPYSLITGPGINGFGGASTTMVGVGGSGRAGVAATNLTLLDVGDGTRSSTNTFAASVQYVNVGAPLIGARYGHWLSAIGVVPVPGYVAASVRSVLEVNYTGATGYAFTADDAYDPGDIIMAFDGTGGLADILIADFSAVANPDAATIEFSALSLTPAFNIPVGASIRIRGTVTLIADPDATIGLIDFPLDLGNDPFNLGFGGSSNATTEMLPEPASLSLLLLGATALLRRRRA